MATFKAIEKFSFSILLSLLFFAAASCSSNKSEQENSTAEVPATAEQEAPETTVSETPTTGNGVGPIESVTVGDEIDKSLVKKGQSIFDSKCIICHAMDNRVIGPALSGVTERRSPAWIMNMILNPQEMIAKDSVAKALLEVYKTPMIDQNLSEEEARAVLEFFRSKDKS